ncbi:hypothetical protein [Loktanella sp. M215]|uniref:hypothetical protein n=1 Tax=Loktanella sp. M215 TaxID=2675431 RepID=UPI001F47EE8D|nr:hypothetical protein [Loktanella sp. M215]MCF7700781.1 hypothetical protein [Loktanella sp. M215]
MPEDLDVKWLNNRGEVGATDCIGWGGRAAPGNLMNRNSSGTIRFRAQNDSTVCAIWHPGSIRSVSQGAQPPGFFDGHFADADEPLALKEGHEALVLHFETSITAFGVDVDFARGDPGNVYDVAVEVSDHPQLHWMSLSRANVPADATVFCGARGNGPVCFDWITIWVFRHGINGVDPVNFAINSIDIAV